MIEGKRNRCSEFALIGHVISRIPRWERIVTLTVALSAGIIIASRLGGAEIGIEVYHATILTVLAWLTYKYAKSTHSMARAIVDLGKASRRETLLSMAQKVSEERLILHEILAEIRKAEAAPRPPFELSAWEHNRDKLEAIKDWTDADIHAIASCYNRLTQQNMETHLWQELQERLQGLVDVEKRRSIDMTLKALEQENLAVIRPVISMLVGHLKV